MEKEPGFESICIHSDISEQQKNLMYGLLKLESGSMIRILRDFFMETPPSALDSYAHYVFHISRSLEIVATMTDDVPDPAHRPPCIRCIWFNSQVTLVLRSLKIYMRELNDNMRAFRDTLSTSEQYKFSLFDFQYCISTA